MLRIALPNGSLEKETLRLLFSIGIDFITSHRRYRARSNDPRIAEAVFMRPHIIPYLVGKGSYDLGITGSDLHAEAGDCGASIIGKLDHDRSPDHKWRLVLLAGKDNPAMCLKDIEDDAVILSEYPRTTQEVLDLAGKRTGIHFSHGSTEAHMPNDFPYGVCIASSGATLKANGLKIIHVLSTETAVLLGGPKRFETKEREATAISLIREILP